MSLYPNAKMVQGVVAALGRVFPGNDYEVTGEHSSAGGLISIRNCRTHAEYHAAWERGTSPETVMRAAQAWKAQGEETHVRVDR